MYTYDTGQIAWERIREMHREAAQHRLVAGSSRDGWLETAQRAVRQVSARFARTRRAVTRATAD